MGTIYLEWSLRKPYYLSSNKFKMSGEFHFQAEGENLVIDGYIFQKIKRLVAEFTLSVRKNIVIRGLVKFSFTYILHSHI